ncbi:MAG: nicotinamide-nucleotide amidohydrolase family protein [Thermoleophilia bacterium]
MRAAIITVGTELTDGRTVDINTGFIATELELRGIRVEAALTVPDKEAAISDGLLYALGRGVKIVIIAGGLGPTQDDITAPAVARALGRQVRLDADAAAMVAAAVGSSSEDLLPHQLKQATLPAGSRPLSPAGSAPGFILAADVLPSDGEAHDATPPEGGASAAFIVVLPGVPWELATMWESAIGSPELAAVLKAAQAPSRRALCFYQTGEPAIALAVEEFLGGDTAGIEISICARYAEIVLEAAYPPEREGRVSELMKSIEQRFAGQIYSYGESIEVIAGNKLKERKQTLAIGESCTGGMLGAAITGVGGASQFFLGGVIAYDNRVKKALLKVRQQTLDAVGAVSEAVAQQMAIGAREECGADYGIGVTGIAGPTGGTPEKPVGLVFICVSSREGDLVRGFNFPGGRDEIRRAAVVAALHMLDQKLDPE